MNTLSADTEISSKTSSQEPAAGAAIEPGQADNYLSSTSVEQLIIGRLLQSPLYDDEGVLLLAEGSTITAEFKQYLANRQIASVKLHADDIGNVTLDVSAGETGESEDITDELAEKLDQVVESGELLADNSGPALRNQISQRGCEGYDPKQQSEIADHHARNGSVLDGMLRDVLNRRGADGEAVAQMASKYMRHMAEDLDCVMASVFTASGKNGIAGHCVEMCLLGMAIGIEMDLDKENVERIGIAGLVHDWGMARVPEEIRSADRILTDMEFLEIKKHPIHSLELLERCRGVPNQVPLISYQVHERPNGNGYPRNRPANFIHLFAKILNVADAYRALVTRRPYRPPLKPYAANECLLRQARSGDVDAEVVRALLRVMSLFPIGSFVVLNDGSIARVLRRNGDDYANPIVQIVQDAQGERVPPGPNSGIVNLGEDDLHVQQALPTPGTDEIGLTDVVVEMPRFNNSGEATAAGSGRPAWQSSAALAQVRKRVSIEQYDMKQRRAVHRAMNLADRCSQSLDGGHKGDSRHARVSVRTTVAVCLSVDATAARASGRVDTFRAMARDVSRGGLSFLHPEALEESRILIGIDVPNAGRQWIEADIVRRREIATEGFWEYGVAFRRRVGD